MVEEYIPPGDERQKIAPCSALLAIAKPRRIVRKPKKNIGVGRGPGSPGGWGGFLFSVFI